MKDEVKHSLCLHAHLVLWIKSGKKKKKITTMVNALLIENITYYN